MKTKIITYLAILIIATACMTTGNFITDKKIKISQFSETAQVNITTTVEKYSFSKKWFYGKITIKNKTNKNFYFNFNQCMNVDGKIITADYNFLPISYAAEALRILPKKSVTWAVVWKIDIDTIDSKKILIINDEQMLEYRP